MPHGRRPTPATPLAALWRPEDRPSRVTALVVAVIVMSFADLYMTLVHLRSFGMIEANPIARLVMEYDCPWVLALWKAATVVLGAGILLWHRRRRSAELGALFCWAILTALCLQWIRYSDQVSRNTALMHALRKGEPAFVQMSADAP